MILVGQYDSPPRRGVAAPARFTLRTRYPLGVRRLRRHAPDQSLGPHPVAGAGERRGPGRFRRDPGPYRRERGARARPHPAARGGAAGLFAPHSGGAIDKAGGGVVYERLVRPSRYRWPEWIERCRTQAVGALAALDAADWPTGLRLDQSQITAACLMFYLKVNAPELIPPGQYPMLDALLARCEPMEAFQATAFTEYKVPRAE